MTTDLVREDHARRSLTGVREQRATKLVFLACGITSAAWAPLVPYAKARVHANDQQFGLLLLCFGLGSIPSMPVMGRLAGRWGCKLLIQVTAIGAMAALVSLALASHTATLAASLFAFGGCIGSLDVVMNMQALLVDEDSEREWMPTFHAFFSLGGISGAVLMSALLWVNLRPAAASLMIIAVGAVLLVLSLSGLLPYGNQESEERAGFAWPVPTVVALGLLAFLSMLAEGSMLDWSAVYLVDRIHLLAKQAGVGFVAFSIAMTASRLIGSRALARFGRARVVTTGALIAGSGFALAVLFPTPAAAVAGFALVGLGLGNIVPLFFSLAAGATGSLGLNVAFVTTLGYSGVLTGPALIGFLVHASSFELAFLVVAFMLAFVGFASLPLTKRAATS